MAGNKLDGVGLTVIEGGMPGRPPSEKDNMIFLDFKVPPPFKQALPGLVKDTGEDFPSTVARKLYLRGFAAYLMDGHLSTPEEREARNAFLEKWAAEHGAEAVDVQDDSADNLDSRRRTG